MSEHKQHDWSDDPRLTALALGELEGDERAALEAELAQDPVGQAALDDVMATAALLGEELAGELAADTSAEAGLSSEDRAEIAAQAGRASRRRPVLVRTALAVSGLAATGLAAELVWQATTPGASIGARLASVDSAPAASPVVPASAKKYGGRPSAPGTSARLTQREMAEVMKLGYTTRNSSPGAPPQADGARLESLGYVVEEAEELALRVELADALFDDARPIPPRNEAYDRIIENPFVFATDDPLSTFSIDVDTASYANVRRYLNSGQLPPPDAVRIEEMLNYFSYAYEETDGAHPFSITTEVAAAPWAPSHRLVRVGLRGDEIPIFEPKEKNLVFLLDVSGSMNNADKLPLLKRSMRLLVDNLGARDRVAIVVYAGASGVVLPPTPCDRKEEILAAIEGLQPGGSTHASQGIELAYALCEGVRAEGGVNRVILATDGDFNVGVTDDDALISLIERKREGGVSLSVLGFGTGNLKDSKMEKLADHGNGNYAYIDSLEEARKVLVREMGGTLETIAKDVKIQVEFDSEKVVAHRLIGYENRVLAHEDFADDTKDAGEIGAGHRVTALYEVVVSEAAAEAAEMLDSFSPGKTGSYGEGVDSLGTVRLRYKQPDGDESRLVERGLPNGAASAQGSRDLRFAAGVAAFGMVLRGSQHVGAFTLRDAYELAFSGAADDPFGYRTEFLRLVERAIELSDSGVDER